MILRAWGLYATIDSRTGFGDDAFPITILRNQYMTVYPGNWCVHKTVME